MSSINLQRLQPQAQKEGFVVLHTASASPQAGQTIMGINPKVKLKKWPEIKQFLRSLSKSKSNFPLSNGLIGYFAYPNVTLSNNIPDQLFYGYEKLTTFQSPVSADNYPRLQGYETKGKLQTSVTKKQYLKKIHYIKELLAAGEVYQINYAIRFRKKFEGDPYALFLKLVEVNPAEFSAFLNCGEFQIVSASPERLFKAEKGKIITQPIKGTVSNLQSRNLRLLLDSEKERAELDMITDLERNDIGKICEYGALKINKERAIMELPNLWHTYSEVQGRLSKNIDEQDVINAMFPGGSITGCPKLRAMEYIEQLEDMPRNIYTGSIGYITNQESALNMDFNIAIRTILIKNGIVEFWAGGGIVWDSDPEKEYEECMLKAERFLDII